MRKNRQSSPSATPRSEHKLPAKPPSQHRRFKAMARQLECNPSPEQFEKNLRQIAQHRPPTPKGK